MQPFENIQRFVESFPEIIQFLGVAIAAMIPFVEGYGATIVGIAVGVPIWGAVIAAILGNFAIVSILTVIAVKTRDVIQHRKASTPDVIDNSMHTPAVNTTSTSQDTTEVSNSAVKYGQSDSSNIHTPANTDNAREQRLRKFMNRYGIAGTTLIGMLFIPTHVIAPTLVSFGLKTKVVLIWQVISITLYAVVSALLIIGVFNLIGT